MIRKLDEREGGGKGKREEVDFREVLTLPFVAKLLSTGLFNAQKQINFAVGESSSKKKVFSPKLCCFQGKIAA